ncbi:hypothetical protein DBR11_25445 [Pedobacter sp. HMWF019]|uniref:DUF4262 domain-containing protein n=1 Tax=Pedobacter sp. HMWF019 TaxID=2056856 RepID=UPI000D36F9F2|nr:DUF4262 domain-containing protein [Pedobacter sp. HMWF019]PTS93390.1 hypothetical protein DBR11_25445 [Pedobacter sp. HMWF019]
MTNNEFLDIIQSNIDERSFHITLVNGGQHPDFSYSIGLAEKLGFELIVAGGGFVTIKENESIFEYIYLQLQAGQSVDSKFSLSENNVFYLSKVDPSWCKKLMLGVYDYYKVNEITAYQITPVERTLDIPLMSETFIPNDPIWKWLDMDWNIKAPANSYVVTDFDALKGKTITELTRWEDRVWEMFSGPGPDVKEEVIRIVPLGTILGIDNTLGPIVNLCVGEGLWRESLELSWNKWE